MVSIIQEAPQNRRVPRKPRHTFQIKVKPYVIQPFVIAPVLPGETMKNFMMQTRAVSAPIKNPLVGWWHEYYFYYVKLRDLADRDKFTNMAIDPEFDPTTIEDAGSSRAYYFEGGAGKKQVNWTKRCLKKIVEYDFRDEGVAWDSQVIDGMPIAQVQGNDWTDSLIKKSELITLPDIDVDANADGTITASEVDKARRQWELLSLNNMTDQTFNQYLQTFGVSVPKEEAHDPELLRYIRHWSYPTNTVDPATGTPSSALSWSINERADKDRFFTEPGFIIGVTVTRPKVYNSKQAGSAVQLMNDAFSWLPAVMAGDKRASLKEVPAGDGPLKYLSEDYVVDIRDIFVHGDQFVNYSLSDSESNLVGLPSSSFRTRFVTSSDVDSLFVGADKTMTIDGIINFNILGKQIDTYPSQAGLHA